MRLLSNESHHNWDIEHVFHRDIPTTIGPESNGHPDHPSTTDELVNITITNVNFPQLHFWQSQCRILLAFDRSATKTSR